MLGKYGSLFKADEHGNTGLGQMFRGAAYGAQEGACEYFSGMKDMIVSDSLGDKFAAAFFGLTAPLLLVGLPAMDAAYEAGEALKKHHHDITQAKNFTPRS